MEDVQIPVQDETPFEVTRIWPNDPVAVKPGSLPDLNDIATTEELPPPTVSEGLPKEQAKMGIPGPSALDTPVVKKSLRGRLVPELETHIEDTALRYGLDPEYLRATSLVESGGGRNLASPLSSARGAFQFIDSTWATYGRGADRMDHSASTDAVARLTLDNKRALERAIGRTATNADLYLAHQQGAGGAIALLSNPTALAKDLVGYKAVTNNLPASLRGNADTMTGQQFADFIRSKYDRAAGSASVTGVIRDAASPPSPIDYTAPPPAPPGTAWTSAQAEALRLADREQKAGFFDGFGAGFKDNLTGRLLGHGNPAFTPDPSYVPDFKKLSEGIRPEFHYPLTQAVSAAHADSLRNEALARQTLEDRLTRDHGFFTGAGRIIGSLADPVAIGVALATGGAGSLLAEGAGLGVAGTRILQAGIGAATNIGVDLVAPNDPPGVGHLVVSGLLGAGFGAAFGPLGRNAATAQEAYRLEQLGVRMARSVKDELNGTVSPQALEGVTTLQKPIADAVANVGEDVAPMGRGGWLRFWSEGGRAATSSNPVTRLIGSLLGTDVVGKGALTNAQAADQVAERLFRKDFAAWRSTLKTQFAEWNSEQGAGRFSGFSATRWQEFNEQISKYTRSKSATRDAEFPPPVVKAGKEFQRIMADRAEYYNNPLKDAGIAGRAMAFLDLSETYVPRVWSPARMSMALETHGIEKVQTVIAGSLLRSTPEMDEAVARRIADHIVKTRAYGFDENLNNFLSAKDITVFKEYLEQQIGLAREDVENLAKLFGKKEGGEPSLSNLKRRLGLDESYVHESKDGTKLSIDELFENNADALMHDYLRRSSGRIALAQRRVHDHDTGELLIDGIQTDTEFNRLLRMAEERGVREGMDRQQITKEIEGLQWMYDRLMGRPDPAVFGETAQWLRLLRTYNFARLMGQMGFAQLMDMGSIIGNVGVKSFLQHSGGFAREFSDGKLILKHGLDRELEAMFGMGTDSLRAFKAMTLEGELHMRADPTKSARGQFLQKAQNVADVAAEWTTHFSGMHAVQSWQQLVFGRAAAQKFADMASDGATRRSAQQLLRYMGISPEMEKRIFQQVNKHFDTTDGVLFGRKVTRMNLDKWDDQEASATFQNALFRWSRHVVQETDIGAMNRIMSKPLAQTMLQFRSFIATAWENQTLHHIMNHDGRSFSTMAWATITGALVYWAQMHVQALGRSDSEAFLQSKGLGANYDWSKLGPAIFQRSGWSSIVPMLADTGLNITGFDGIFNAGFSGRASNTIFSNPSVGLLNDIQKAARGTNQSFQEGREMTQDEARAWLRLAPWATAVPFVNLSSTLISDRPEPTLRQ